jgi:hypothetical protein
MSNFLEEYLIRLGFETSQPELNKFKSALKEANAAAEHHTSGIVQQFVKWQGAIVGAFAAVGIATVGMMDKVADADLGFKISAQKMFLSVDAARALTIANKALGHSLEDIAWNPELHQRFEQLWQEQKQLLGSSPANAEQTLQRIRDVRFEITKAQVALQYIARDVTVMLYNALGGDAFLVKLRGWVEWVVQHQAQISQWLTNVLVPILKDAAHVMHDVWLVAEKLAQAFVRIVGAISGDDSLRNGAVTFESLGRAIDTAAGYMVKFVDAMTSAQLVVLDMVMTLADLVQGFYDLANLRFSKAAGDFSHALGDAKSAGGDLTGGGALILGAGALALGKGVLRSGAGGLVEGAGGAAGIAGILGSTLAALGLGGLAQYLSRHDDLSSNTFAGRELAWENQFVPLRWLNGLRGGSGDVADAARRYGIDPALAAAVARQESGGRQYDRNGNLITSSAGALGMFQLMPGTARRLGVDPSDQSQNIEGGIHLLSMLLRKYGDIRETLAAYNWGESRLDDALKRHGGHFALDYLPKETQNYVRSIEGSMGQQISIHAPITITGTNLTGEEIRKHTSDGITEAMNRANRKDLVNAQGVYA